MACLSAPASQGSQTELVISDQGRLLWLGLQRINFYRQSQLLPFHLHTMLGLKHRTDSAAVIPLLHNAHKTAEHNLSQWNYA